MSEEDRTIFRQDLYKELKVTSETLRQWIKKGKIPPADLNVSQRKVAWRASSLRAAGLKIF
jgi:predicted site-specific integrase-resolvase